METSIKEVRGLLEIAVKKANDDLDTLEASGGGMLTHVILRQLKSKLEQLNCHHLK